MARKLLIAVVLVYAAALFGAGLAQPDPEPAAPSTQPRSTTATPRTRPPQLVGMTLNLYHLADLQPARQAVDAIAALGCNSLQVVTPIFQDHGGSPIVVSRTGPGFGPTDAQLLEVLRYARSKGFITVLMPQVNFTRPRGNEWRGKLAPPRWSVWWDSYLAALDRFLTLADQADVEVFSIGCELLSTEKPEHLDHWRSVAAHARSRFDGMLVYSTNWDSYQDVGFWDRVDAIGISAYYDLTRGLIDRAQPASAELDARWTAIRRRVLTYAASQNRPVLFTELGYPSLPWALSKPWNYIASPETPADPAAQNVGYEAFIEAWGDLIIPPNARHNRPPDRRVAGVLFYKWDLHANTEADTGYGVAGKPAYQTLKRWLNAAPNR